MSPTDIKAKNAKPLEKEYRLTDGFGMFLRVTPKGSKYWQMAYRFEGKQKHFSIGVYPAVSLSDARQRRDEARRLLAQGIDPNAKKQAEVKELKAKRDKTRTFAMVAKAWFATKTKWSKDYGDSVWKRLETYVFPATGDKDVAELDTGDLRVPVKRVEALGYLEVAMRIQQYITAILRHAVQQKLIRHNPAYDMEGAVQKPQTHIQLCIIHMVRNSLKYVSWKDYKAVTSGLKASLSDPGRRGGADGAGCVRGRMGR